MSSALITPVLLLSASVDCLPASHYADLVAVGVGPVTGLARQPVGLADVVAVSVAHAGYHVGWTVTVAGALTRTVGSAVHAGAVADWPPVMRLKVAEGYETALSWRQR